jgi:epoxyqueuosine reductase
MISFAQLQGHAAREGLSALAVIAPPGPLPAAPLQQMLADGVGDLGWLKEQAPLRLDPVAMLPTARSLVVFAWHYQPTPGSGTLRRARYAAGKDYHVILRPKIGRIGTALGERNRACVDSAPISERALAQMAGLGWIGRNALLIDPTAGTYRLLGVLLTEAEIERHDAGKRADRCGACIACEKRCPTAALVERRVLTERCISYLTIEHQGVIPRELALRFEGWWFGCDLCQEVCPWNRFAPPADDPRLQGDDRDEVLLAITAEDFDRHFAGRAIRRVGYVRFRRNLLVALVSLGRIEACAGLLAEGLPLVLAQARELNLPGVPQDASPCISP